MSLDLMKSYGTNLTTFAFKEVSQVVVIKLCLSLLYFVFFRIIYSWFIWLTMSHQTSG